MGKAGIQETKDSHFILKNTPCCQSINRRIVPTARSSHTKVQGRGKIKCLWKMSLCAPTLSAQPFRGIPILLYFHLEPAVCCLLLKAHSLTVMSGYVPSSPMELHARKKLLIDFPFRRMMSLGGFSKQICNTYNASREDLMPCWVPWPHQPFLADTTVRNVSFDEQSTYTLRVGGMSKK